MRQENQICTLPSHLFCDCLTYASRGACSNETPEMVTVISCERQQRMPAKVSPVIITRLPRRIPPCITIHMAYRQRSRLHQGRLRRADQLLVRTCFMSDAVAFSASTEDFSLIARTRHSFVDGRDRDTFRLCRLVACSKGSASLAWSDEWQREYATGHLGRCRLRLLHSMIHGASCLPVKQVLLT